ncbi:TRAG family protein (plasmid) [Allomeiothermus silvanus DSM 9946]|uniref:TRAG family protein n=1 Tax=Allomeiothermus silvanus (strain ATCC 700542 / DSM 9946 / NBRC 106475 / NCIMB 13440 / VI-R2) TaxID=526227 RepID=D7BJQ4_ALLS1|nr:type IV secretory system conjugative DNA transfer family protein [Allomeiothermus silvanus]ADH65410.1 TRAG family protein [Allomeiothermus silvanus DSM 9946]
MNPRTHTDLPEAARAVSIRYGNPRQRRLAVFLAALGMLLAAAGVWGGWKAYTSFESTARPFLQAGWQLSPLDLLESPRNPRACLGNPACREAFFHRWQRATPPLVGLPFEGPGLYLSLLAVGLVLTLLGLLLAKLLESEQIGLESTLSQAFGGVALGVLGYSLPGLVGLAAPPWLESLLALAGLVLGVNARNRHRALYSALRARYADARELRRMTLTPANRALALPLARLSPDKGEPLIGSVPTPAKKELDHLLVVAPTRGGKGLHIRQTLWHWGGSAVVVDLKGDAYRETALRREELGGRCFLLDPEGYGSCYDPFSEMVRDESVASAAQLMMVSAQDKDPIFSERASYLMEAFIYLAQYRQESTTSLMYGLMSRGEDAVYLEFKRLKQQPPLPDRPRELLEKAIARFNFFYGSDKDDKFRASCYGTFSTRARPLVSEGVRAMTQRSDFTARDLIERPTTLYIRLSEENLDFTKGIVQILISTLTGQLTRTIDREQGGYARVPVLFVFDEAKRIPIPSIANGVSTWAGRNMYAAIYVQDMSQLEGTYGEGDAKTVLANTAQIFYLGNPNLETAQYVSQKLGRIEVPSYSYTAQRSKDGQSRSMSYNLREVDLLSVDDFLAGTNDEVVVFPRAARPVRAWRVLPPEEMRQYARAPEPPRIARSPDLPPEPIPTPPSPSPRPPSNPPGPASTQSSGLRKVLVWPGGAARFWEIPEEERLLFDFLTMDFIPDPLTQRVVDLGDLSRPFALVAPPEQKDRAEEHLRHNGVQIRQHLPPPVYGRLWLLGGQWKPSALQTAEEVLRRSLFPLRLPEKIDGLVGLKAPSEAYLPLPYPPEQQLNTWIGLLGYQPRVLWLDQPGGTAVLPHWRGPRISLMGRGPAEVPPTLQAALSQLRAMLR